jgi:Tol biopolymer transport system component
MLSRLAVALILGLPLIATGVAAQQGSVSLLSQLVWFDRSGKRLGTVGPLGNHGNIELSPDGRQAAVTVLDRARGTRDLWLYNVANGMRTQYTATTADENWAIWSRDGNSIIFNSSRNGGLDLFRAPASNGAMAMPLLVDGMWPVSLAPDGRHLLFVINSPQRGNDVMVLPLFGDGTPFPFAQSEVQENWAAFSPNGRWVAFSSSETGISEVYVAAFPPTGVGMAGKRQVSVGGGSQARWSRDGREIFYIGQDRSLMVTSVNGEGAIFEAGPRSRLFEPQFYFFDSHVFDVAPDGRLLVNTVVASPQTPSSIARR